MPGTKNPDAEAAKGMEKLNAAPTSEAPGPESNLSLHQPRNSRGCDKTSTLVSSLSQPEKSDSCDKVSTMGDSLSQLADSYSCDKSRIDALRFQLEQGICLRPTTRAALDLALRFSVSLATAYRHLKRGTLPAEERRLGGDGKRRPAHPRGSTVTQSHRLAMTIRRLARQIDPAELEPADFQILSEATDAIRALWEGAR